MNSKAFFVFMEITSRRGTIGVGKAVAKVDGKIAVNAELTFVIEG